MKRRHELTDTQWERIKDLLPGKAADPGRTAADNRLFVNAVLFVLKTGIPWADLPERFGKVNTIWKRYDRWSAAGGWPGKKDDADARRCLGRSRGGLTSKLHAAVSGAGRLLRLVVTAGQCGDAPQAPALLAGLHARHVLADAAYDSDAIRRQVREMRARACIRPDPRRRRRKHYDRRRYRHRNVIERFFRRVKQCRRVATRYEKKAVNFAAFVWLAAFVTAEE